MVLLFDFQHLDAVIIFQGSTLVHFFIFPVTFVSGTTEYMSPCWHKNNEHWTIKIRGGKQVMCAAWHQSCRDSPGLHILIALLQSMFDRINNFLFTKATFLIHQSSAFLMTIFDFGCFVYLTCFGAAFKVGGKLYPKDKSEEIAGIAVSHLKMGEQIPDVKKIVVPCWHCTSKPRSQISFNRRVSIHVN